MKKAILFYSMVAVMILATISVACKKDKYLDRATWESNTKLDGTTWEGNTKIDYTYLKLSIEFANGKATIYGKASGYLTDTFKGSATYTCNENDISLNIKWLDNWVYDYDEGKWKGTIKGDTMYLRNVYGETVEFTKL